MRLGPKHLRQPHESLGYGADYRYDHAEDDAYAVRQVYLPETLRGARWYEPTQRGYEKTIAERIAWWEELKREAGA
jgi:putative ATPase